MITKADLMRIIASLPDDTQVMIDNGSLYEACMVWDRYCLNEQGNEQEFIVIG